jgi:hypothetical protein
MQYPELLAVFRVAGPFPLHLEDFSGGRGQEVPHHRHQVPAAVYFDFGNGVAILIIGIGDPLDLALEVGEHQFKPLSHVHLAYLYHEIKLRPICR